MKKLLMLMVLVVWLSPGWVVAQENSSSGSDVSIGAAKLFGKAKNQYLLAQFEKALATLIKAEKVAANDGSGSGSGSGSAGTSTELKAKILVYQSLIRHDLEQKAKAKAAMKKALLASMTACDLVPKTKGTVIKLCQALKESLRGQLLVTIDPAESKAWVDDKPVKVGVAVELSPGLHLVTAQSPDDRRQTREIEVRAEKKTLANFEFTPVVAVKPFPDPPRKKPIVGKKPAKKKPVKPTRKGRIWTWVALAAAGATAVTGIGLQISARSKYSDWQEGNTAGSLSQAEADHYNALADRIRSEEAASWAMIGLGVALGATTAALYFLEDTGSEKPTPTAPAVKPKRVQISPFFDHHSQGIVFRAHF